MKTKRCNIFAVYSSKTIVIFTNAFKKKIYCIFISINLQENRKNLKISAHLNYCVSLESKANYKYSVILF